MWFSQLLNTKSIQQVSGRSKVLGPISKVRSQQSSSSLRNLKVCDASQYRPTLPPMLSMRDRNAKILTNDRIRTDNRDAIIASGMLVGAPADREPSPKAAAAALAVLTRAQSREKKIDADRRGMARVDHHIVGKDQVVDDAARQVDMRLSVDTRRRSR